MRWLTGSDQQARECLKGFITPQLPRSIRCVVNGPLPERPYTVSIVCGHAARFSLGKVKRVVAALLDKDKIVFGPTSALVVRRSRVAMHLTGGVVSLGTIASA